MPPEPLGRYDSARSLGRCVAAGNRMSPDDLALSVAERAADHAATVAARQIEQHERKEREFAVF